MDLVCDITQHEPNQFLLWINGINGINVMMVVPHRSDHR